MRRDPKLWFPQQSRAFGFNQTSVLLLTPKALDCCEHRSFPAWMSKGDIQFEETD